MRYVTSPELFWESLALASAMGAMPPTYLQPSFSDTTTLDLEDVHILPVGEMQLFIAPHTGSWCLLTEEEATVAISARQCSLGTMRELYSSIDPVRLEEFFTRLFQRGLLA